jgi:hypothetical protein
MILIRYLLICIIGYLIVRAFVKFGEEDKSQEGRKQPVEKVSKRIGEYIDYEEIKKEK